MPIEWFVTTASQSRIWLKLLSDDSNKVGICLLCRSTQLHATTSFRSQFATTCDSSYVLQSCTPYWKSTTLYYSVLQSTTPVLLCTKKYYSSTTQYYSSTTLYYTVLLQYYSVLQSTTPQRIGDWKKSILKIEYRYSGLRSIFCSIFCYQKNQPKYRYFGTKISIFGGQVLKAKINILRTCLYGANPVEG